MLKPAAIYKNMIEAQMLKYFYTEEMFLVTGCLNNWIPEIADEPDENTFQYAIVDGNGNLIGYLCYEVDWYSLKAYNFGVISFDKGNPIIGEDLYSTIKKLYNRMHKIEWKMIEGNPVERNYDHICDRFNGYKHFLTDSIKDKDGNYRDDIIYEIINKEN